MTAILVAEDDPGICDLMTEILEADLCATVTCAKTGSAAAEAIQMASFDLAIIDVGMPGISGYELAQRAANNNIPVLLCTGYPDALIKLKHHDVPHLAKPFQFNELVYKAAGIITHTAENIRQVKASLATLQMTTASLRAEIAESRRLLSERRSLLDGGRSSTRQQPMSNPQPSEKTPEELIAEFRELTGIKSSNVAYEDGMIVFHYSTTGITSDRLTLATFRRVIDHERRMQATCCSRAKR
jgi:CheY-like chemotaxis protein